MGSIDQITPPGRLIATGDLHDNPDNFERLIELARLTGVAGEDGATDDHTHDLPHITLHEIIHPDRLINGMDFSYRSMVRVAALKAAHPERVHTLLANHELAQMVGAGIVKNGIRVVEAFNEGIDYVFGSRAAPVMDAVRAFVRSMPLALRCVTPRGDILCAHSIPGPAMMPRFDASVLTRDLTEDDYAPRQGAAHMMVWGRDYDHDQIEDLVERWGVNLFVLGHEKAEHGVMFVPPAVLVINSDHERGVYLPIDLDDPPRADEAAALVQRLAPTDSW
ncbi:MAG: hypothetical protein KDA05_11260 [Phycisphaerales bacterium]|nr:hypothetical protein [Phycisphaerales bacterium]MCB9840317.1 hypothetical protein [Phycisphaeraceae bacterium]